LIGATMGDRDAVSDLPFAHGGPPLRGVLRASPEDFFVDEDLGFVPDGQGEHVFVRVEKRGANTDWVARELARYAHVAPDAVSYAGLKDRHAVTRQTFSVHLPGKQAEPDWSALQHAEFSIIETARHGRKLKRGALKGNNFKIILRDTSGDRAAAEARIAVIAQHGVPNYFGEQRFGRGGANVARARAMFAGKRVQRHERSLLLSSARSFLFNAVLAERIEGGKWRVALPGEVWMLAGTHSIFGPEPMTPELAERFARGDIAPTGPLWGKGELRSAQQVAELEHGVIEQYRDLAIGLDANGLNQERRSLSLRPLGLTAQWLSEASLELTFNLSSGSYATVLLREICEWSAPTPARDPPAGERDPELA
jgi:tRNA pseudouridine13 synthase